MEQKIVRENYDSCYYKMRQIYYKIEEVLQMEQLYYRIRQVL